MPRAISQRFSMYFMWTFCENVIKKSTPWLKLYKTDLEIITYKTDTPFEAI